MIKISGSISRDINSIAQKHFDKISNYLIFRLNYVGKNIKDKDLHGLTANSFNKLLNTLTVDEKSNIKSLCSHLLIQTDGIYQNLRNLILCNPEKLIDKHNQLTADFNICANHWNVIKKIFCYSDFSIGNIKYSNDDSERDTCSELYSAYDLCISLNIPVCPFCNRQFITILNGISSKKKVRPDLDHFYKKDEFPLLALSFYNLIPSCSICNSRLKHEIDFSEKPHVHPYNEGFGNDAVFRFKTDLQNGKTYLLIKDEESKKGIRIKNSAQEFETETLYNNHTDIAREIYDKMLKESPDHFDSIVKTIKKIKVTPEEFYQFYFGNYMKVDNFEKRPLAKFTYDLVEELGILKLAKY